MLVVLSQISLSDFERSQSLQLMLLVFMRKIILEASIVKPS